MTKPDFTDLAEDILLGINVSQNSHEAQVTIISNALLVCFEKGRLIEALSQRAEPTQTIITNGTLEASQLIAEQAYADGLKHALEICENDDAYDGYGALAGVKQKIRNEITGGDGTIKVEPGTQLWGAGGTQKLKHLGTYKPGDEEGN